jgi:hypothetical protein
MRRYLVIFALLTPIVASDCAGCSYTTGQLGGSGSQSVTFENGEAKPTNDDRYWDGQAMEMRAKN